MYLERESFHVNLTPHGNFDVKHVEKGACLYFVECPKFLTLYRHANMDEITPLHCYLGNPRRVVDFWVPQQKLGMQITPQGMRYTAVRVTKNGVVYYLFVCEVNRMGFLVREERIHINKLRATGGFRLLKRKVHGI